MLYVLIAVALLGMLTFAVSRSTEQDDGMDRVEMDEQISRMMSQAATLMGAVQQMVVNGFDPSVLATALDPMKPDDTDWDTPPHLSTSVPVFKVYHPYGGGVKYMEATGPVSAGSTVAKDFEISPGSSVEGVGPTDTGGDILFTARITSAAACTRVNEKLRGTGASMPTITVTADFDDLLAGTDTALTASGNCAACEGLPAACVMRGGGGQWLFYKALSPK